MDTPKNQDSDENRRKNKYKNENRRKNAHETSRKDSHRTRDERATGCSACTRARWKTCPRRRSHMSVWCRLRMRLGSWMGGEC